MKRNWMKMLLAAAGIGILLVGGGRVWGETATAPLNGTVSFQTASAPDDTLYVNSGPQTIKATGALKIQGHANSRITLVAAEGSGIVHVADVVLRDGESLYRVIGGYLGGGGGGGGAANGWHANYNRGGLRLHLEVNEYGTQDDIVYLGSNGGILHVRVLGDVTGSVQVSLSANPDDKLTALPGSISVPAGETPTDVALHGAEIGQTTITASAEVNGTPISDQITVQVIRGINLVIQNLAEETEEKPHELDPGAFIIVNDDYTENNFDRQYNKVADNGEDWIAGHRIVHNDSKLVDAQIVLEGVGTGTWKVNYPEGDGATGGIYLWKESSLLNKYNRISSGADSAVITLPATIHLKIEGIRSSSQMRNLPITATFTPSVGGIGEPRSDAVNATVIGCDLDVDSDNNSLTGEPDCSTAEDWIEIQTPGKFVFVNHNDDDNDQVPDYADLSVSGEQNMVPLILSIQIPIDWQTEASKIKVKFSYAGQASLPNMQGDDSIGNGYKKYTANKLGTLRLWNAQPGSERAGSHYLVPNQEYTAEQLGFSGTKTFYIEGINSSSEAIDITATVTWENQTVTDTVKVTVVEPKLYLNTGNNLDNSDGLRTGVPDVQYNLNEDDRVIKDQKQGSVFWKMKDSYSDNEMRFEDMAPLMINLPSAIAGTGSPFKYTLVIRSTNNQIYENSGKTWMQVMKAASPGTDRLKYLFDKDIGEDQMYKESYGFSGSRPSIPLSDGDNEFIFGSSNDVWQFGSSQYTTVILSLYITTSNGQLIQEVDSARITFKAPETMWSLVSSRGEANIPFSYPTENNRTVDIHRYPSPTTAANRDPNKPHYLVYIHGFNVTPNEAVDSNNIVFKRTYWLGFRGNYIGFTWHGDENRIPGIGLSPFDTNIQNAFQTSEPLRLFLSLVKGWAGSSNNVDVMTHSLGNLVMWDALRLHRRLGTGTLIRNAISIEAAVWSECFLPEQDITYPNPPNDSATRVPYSPVPPSIPPNNPNPGITYTVDELKHHSWAFWFNQSNFEAKNSLDGSIYNSYLQDDSALTKMRKNDYGNYEFFGVGNRFPFQYFRNQNNPGNNYRGPDNLWDTVPAMMKFDNRIITDYAETEMLEYGVNIWVRKTGGENTLRPPVGATINPLVGSANFHARDDGGNQWQSGEHSDFKDLPMFKISLWYKNYLGNGSNSAVKLGQD